MKSTDTMIGTAPVNWRLGIYEPEGPVRNVIASSTRCRHRTNSRLRTIRHWGSWDHSEEALTARYLLSLCRIHNPSRLYVISLLCSGALGQMLSASVMDTGQAVIAGAGADYGTLRCPPLLSNAPIVGASYIVYIGFRQSFSAHKPPT